MGSVLTRDQRSINSDGTTKIDYSVPTMMVGGTKDGLMRISRVSESFWHSHENIEDGQRDVFPVMAFEGVSHAQFTSGDMPFNVKNHDLKPDVSESDAHKMVANAMVQYFDQILLGNPQSLDINASKKVVSGFLEAMELEGYYYTKPACNNSPYLVNPDDVTCLHGSTWNEQYS